MTEVSLHAQESLKDNDAISEHLVGKSVAS